MNSSDQINELATALSELHGTVKDPAKSGAARFGSYVTLDALLDTLRPQLSALGLSFVQMVEGDAMQPAVTTRIMHSSGQWLEASATSVAEGNKGTSAVQAVGSTVTYLRRYALMSAFGLAGDDDFDGDAPPARKPQPQAQPAPGGPTYEDGTPVGPNVAERDSYRDYVKAHDGKAPANVHNLRNWLKAQKKVAQPALVDEPANGAYKEVS